MEIKKHLFSQLSSSGKVDIKYLPVGCVAHAGAGARAGAAEPGRAAEAPAGPAAAARPRGRPDPLRPPTLPTR